jgi:hypothetical protein
MLDVVAHGFAVEHAMNEDQGLDELSNAMFLRRAPRDASVCNTGLVQEEKVGVERNQDSLLGRGKCELVRVVHAATSRFLGREHAHSVPSEPLAGRPREMLVHEEP